MTDVAPLLRALVNEYCTDAYHSERAERVRRRGGCATTEDEALQLTAKLGSLVQGVAGNLIEGNESLLAEHRLLCIPSYRLRVDGIRVGGQKVVVIHEGWFQLLSYHIEVELLRCAAEAAIQTGNHGLAVAIPIFRGAGRRLVHRCMSAPFQLPYLRDCMPEELSVKEFGMLMAAEAFLLLHEIAQFDLGHVSPLAPGERLAAIPGIDGRTPDPFESASRHEAWLEAALAADARVLSLAASDEARQHLADGGGAVALLVGFGQVVACGGRAPGLGRRLAALDPNLELGGDLGAAADEESGENAGPLAVPREGLEDDLHAVLAAATLVGQALRPTRRPWWKFW